MTFSTPLILITIHSGRVRMHSHMRLMRCTCGCLSCCKLFFFRDASKEKLLLMAMFAWLNGFELKDDFVYCG